MSVKMINESRSIIEPTAKSKSLDDIYDELMDSDLDITSNSDDIPIPWDADFDIEGQNLVLRGSLLPGGPGDGTCIIKVPLSSASKYYTIYAYDIPDEIIDEVESLGWIVREG